MHISKEMLDAINAECRDPAFKIVAEAPELNLEEVSGCLNKVLLFLRQNISELGENPYLLRIDFYESKRKNRKIDANIVLSSINAGANIIILDKNLYYVGRGRIQDLSAPSISAYSKTNSCCAIHIINGLDLTIYQNGLTMKDMNATSPLSGPIINKKFARNARDYKLSIKECYKYRFRFSEFPLKHWYDKSKRILRADRKTEKIFHDNLRDWLDTNLQGGTVFGNVKKMSNDETDIEIRVHGGPFYIIEVKWLGNNGSTRYSLTALKNGIKQVDNYLIGDPSCLEACLVVYDGRSLVKFKKLDECAGEEGQWKEITKCMNAKLTPRGKGYVFFLESEGASKRI